MNKLEPEYCSAIILAGGKSSRLGKNKSLLEIEGVTFIERTYNLLLPLFAEVAVSTNEAELYNFLNARFIKDEFPGLGPLAGIQAALKKSEAEKIFVVSSDLPFLQQSIILHLLKIKTDESIVLPRARNRIQFLCGIYSKSLLPLIESILENVREAKSLNLEVNNSALSLWNFVERVGAEISDVDYEPFFFDDLFFNVNTPDDYQYVKERGFF